MNWNWKRARTVAAVLAVVAALGLSSCASSDDGNAGSGTQLEVEKGDLKGDPIKIGTLCSCTGPVAASIGKSLEVLRAWGSWTNANGGINGHPVEVVAYDDGQNPTTALAQAKKLVEEDKVMAIVGTMSLVTDSWAKYVSGKGIPVVGGQSVDVGFFTDPNFFASGSTLPLLLLGEVSLAKASGAEKLGLFYCSETPVCAQLPRSSSRWPSRWDSRLKRRRSRRVHPTTLHRASPSRRPASTRSSAR
jgi:branched-chain amino acid transport system substrate-binding protein